MGVGGGQAVGECVGGGVGVGRRAILVFLGVWKGKRGAGGRVFSFLDFFGGRLCGWAGFCVGVRDIGGCHPGVGVVWR